MLGMTSVFGMTSLFGMTFFCHLKKVVIEKKSLIKLRVSCKYFYFVPSAIRIPNIYLDLRSDTEMWVKKLNEQTHGLSQILIWIEKTANFKHHKLTYQIFNAKLDIPHSSQMPFV